MNFVFLGMFFIKNIKFQKKSHYCWNFL